jgi:hypothetical protein
VASGGECGGRRWPVALAGRLVAGVSLPVSIPARRPLDSPLPSTERGPVSVQLKLAKALKGCKKDTRKKERAGCEKQARAKYGKERRK